MIKKTSVNTMRLSWKREKVAAGYSRRDLFRSGGLLATAQALGPFAPTAASAPLAIGPNLYRSIGSAPNHQRARDLHDHHRLSNAPEVKRAMDEASRSYVHMDELMDGVGNRLAEITGAEWGIVTAGCLRGNYSLHIRSHRRLQSGADAASANLTGLKNEVIIPLTRATFTIMRFVCWA